MEDCTNCGGDGVATYTYSPPHTDLRETPYHLVEWSEPTYRTCGACNGTGRRKRRAPTRTGWTYFTIDGQVNHEKTVNEAHRRSREKGNQGWTTRKRSQPPSW